MKMILKVHGHLKSIWFLFALFEAIGLFHPPFHHSKHWGKRDVYLLRYWCILFPVLGSFIFSNECLLLNQCLYLLQMQSCVRIYIYIYISRQSSAILFISSGVGLLYLGFFVEGVRTRSHDSETAVWPHNPVNFSYSIYISIIRTQGQIRSRYSDGAAQE